MIHWPGFITNGWCNDAFVKGLADCQQQGLTQAVGVSNFKLERVKTAQQILKVQLLLPSLSCTLFITHVHCVVHSVTKSTLLRQFCSCMS